MSAYVIRTEATATTTPFAYSRPNRAEHTRKKNYTVEAHRKKSKTLWIKYIDFDDTKILSAPLFFSLRLFYLIFFVLSEKKSATLFFSASVYFCLPQNGQMKIDYEHEICEMPNEVEAETLRESKYKLKICAIACTCVAIAPQRGFSNASVVTATIISPLRFSSFVSLSSDFLFDNRTLLFIALWALRSV